LFIDAGIIRFWRSFVGVQQILFFGVRFIWTAIFQPARDYIGLDMVTSREVLHIRGEHEFAVSPLSLPDEPQPLDAQTAAGFGAVALFSERAREACPTFQLTNENASLIVKVCQRLDGLPLAIELAAARLKLLSLQALLDRLEEHRLQVLTGGPRDLPARQHTLQNTLAWSYDLLSQEEQRLFRQLTVFTGGCILQAVESVYDLLGGKREQALDAITSLLGKHLLYQSVQQYGEPRLQMLSTIREYGWECLCQCGEGKQVQSAHASYYLHLAEEAEKHM
jgi:predicted ATPase